MKKVIRLSVFPSYKKAKALVRGLKNYAEYKEARIKLCLPSNPDKYYAGSGWTSWGDFFDRDAHDLIVTDFMTYEQAKRAVRKLGIRNSNEYSELRKKRKKLPCYPESTYRKEWGGWEVFLGINSKVNNKVFVSYDKAEKIVRAHGIVNSRQFLGLSAIMRRMRIPTHPDCYYGQWEGWKKFLGSPPTRKTVGRFASYAKAKEVVLSLGIKSEIEFNKHLSVLRQNRVPFNPSVFYKQWDGWPAFLGLRQERPIPKDKRRRIHSKPLSYSQVAA